jgi:hypothetical protein
MYVLMLDAIERQWHTATICAALTGGEVEPWDEVQKRFEEYLSGGVRPKTKDEEMRAALGLS